MKNQDTDLQLECLSNQKQIDTEFNSIPSGIRRILYGSNLEKESLE